MKIDSYNIYCLPGFIALCFLLVVCIDSILEMHSLGYLLSNLCSLEAELCKNKLVDALISALEQLGQPNAIFKVCVTEQINIHVHIYFVTGRLSENALRFLSLASNL